MMQDMGQPDRMAVVGQDASSLGSSVKSGSVPGEPAVLAIDAAAVVEFFRQLHMLRSPAAPASPGAPAAPAQQTPSLLVWTPVPTASDISTSSATYQQVAEYQVTANMVGRVIEISFETDSPSVALWNVLIGGTPVVADLKTDNPLTFNFKDSELPSGTAVTIQVKSDGSTTIHAAGAISAEERTP